MTVHNWHSRKILLLQSNLAIRNGLIRNSLVLRNHFPWPICHLLHKNKELLALRNNFRVTKKFLIAKFDCIWKSFQFNAISTTKIYVRIYLCTNLTLKQLKIKCSMTKTRKISEWQPNQLKKNSKHFVFSSSKYIPTKKEKHS